MKYYKIEPLLPFSQNEKGLTYGLNERSTSEFLLAIREKGAVFGGHYHEGTAKEKDPEILWMLSGSMKMWGTSVEGSKKEECLIEAPCRVEIYPQFIHYFEALEKCIFIELNSLEQHIADTKYPTSEG